MEGAPGQGLDANFSYYHHHLTLQTLPQQRNWCHKVVHGRRPMQLQLPLKRQHSHSTLRNKLFQEATWPKIYYIFAGEDGRLRKLSTASRNLTIQESVGYSLPEILSIAGWLKVWFLTIDNYSQVFARSEKKLPPNVPADERLIAMISLANCPDSKVGKSLACKPTSDTRENTMMKTWGSVERQK